MLQTAIGKQVLECVWKKDSWWKIEKCSHFSFEVHVENGLALIAIFHAILPLTRNHSAIRNGQNILQTHSIQFNIVLWSIQMRFEFRHSYLVRFSCIASTIIALPYQIWMRERNKNVVEFDLFSKLWLTNQFDMNVVYIVYPFMCQMLTNFIVEKQLKIKYETWQKQFHYSCFQQQLFQFFLLRWYLLSIRLKYARHSCE